MAEQTFRSPNTYETETDLSAPASQSPSGVPAGVIGTANRGPAFVPVTVGNKDQFTEIFGGTDSKKFGPYAAQEFLKHRSALTYLRVLGAGANATSGDIETTRVTGRVVNAGVKLEGTAAPNDSLGRHVGGVQFLAARHSLTTGETVGMPLFTDNDSYSGNIVNVIRGMVMLASGTRMMVLDGNQSAVGVTFATLDDAATLSSGKFKLIISSTLGNSYSKNDGNSGIKIYTASLNPTEPDYFAKVLNTNPDKFVEEQHYVFADFAVDNELATATHVAVLSGSANTSSTSGESTTPFRNAFGAFDTRYRTPTTSWFISQPFGNAEYDLFRFEALDDGEYANTLYKISISNLKASLDASKPYGTFTVMVRSWDDTDLNPVVLEQYPNCSLDPTAENYVARMIGDRKVSFNFDATVDGDKRVITSGKYDNKSKYVRVIVTDAVDRAIVPQKTLPFGFRGVEILKTNDALTDESPSSATKRLAGVLGNSVHSALSGSILPPVPFRFKITKGEIASSGIWPGQPGPTEAASTQYYWGVKFERNIDPTNPNLTSEKNKLLENYAKMLGISKLDTLVTGSGADVYNNNKFTLAKVALSNASLTDLTSSVANHMREAAYVRDGIVDASTYTVNDGVLSKRVSLATILALSTPSDFNRYSPYAKFTNLMGGGFDGTNFLDKNARLMTDRASSFDAGGGAETGYVAPGLLTNPAGTGQTNSTVRSYLTALDIMTEPNSVVNNLLVVPGIRESYITDYALSKAREYGLAYYIMDVPSYSDEAERLYDDSTERPDVEQTAVAFDGRSIDNNYGGTYWPNCIINDPITNRRVKVPSSVVALGAIGFNDRIAYPWFAPAGFNRAALDSVKNVEVRLNVSDRDRLYDSRINPIATFPRQGFVIYGQRTLQVNKSALDRVNVRRLLLEVKRIVSAEALKVVFENSAAEVRNKFVADVTFKLGLIQARSGVEAFNVICNESNNGPEDEELNRMNGKVIVVPTRTVEWIVTDFIVTKSGITFV